MTEVGYKALGGFLVTRLTPASPPPAALLGGPAIDSWADLSLFFYVMTPSPLQSFLLPPRVLWAVGMKTIKLVEVEKEGALDTGILGGLAVGLLCFGS